MQTSPDLSHGIRTLTLDDFGYTNNISQRRNNSFRGKTLPVNQEPLSKQQARAQLKWNRLYAKSNFGNLAKCHILSPQSFTMLESLKPRTMDQQRQSKHLTTSIVHITQSPSPKLQNSAQKYKLINDQTPGQTSVKENTVEELYEMKNDCPDIKQVDNFSKPFMTQFAGQLGLKHGRTSDEDFKLSSYRTRNVTMPPKRKNTTLKQFLQQQSNILDDLKNEQELAYQNKQREQQLTRLVTQWEEINGRKLQSRLDDMGFPKKIDFEKINALKMRATGIKGKHSTKARFG